MNKFNIGFAEYVEVQIPTGNTAQTVYFPDLPNLRNQPIVGIEVYSSTEQGTTQSGASVQAKADLVNAIVTLYFDGGEYIVVPALSLLRIDGANRQYFADIPNLNGQNIVWTKSKVTMTAGVSNFAGKNFLFNVYYNKK